ncbi:MAG: sugar phosphate nucleotidyltransferase [Thermoprotei archaeon]
MQAVIIAGGLGTRLRPLTNTTPKAMVPIKGKPFLEYKIEALRKQGVDKFTICVGYLGHKITEYFGDGSKLGVKITYSSDGDRLLGPIGALKKAEHTLDEAFLYTYGDNYLDVDCGKLMRRLLESSKLAVMAVYHNRNTYGKSDVEVDFNIEGGLVVRFDKSTQNRGLEWINYGILAIRKDAIRPLKPNVFIDEKEFYDTLIERHEMLAYEVKNRFYDIGTPTSLQEFEDYVNRSVVFS